MTSRAKVDQARQHAIFLEEQAPYDRWPNAPPERWLDVAEAWLVAADAAEEYGDHWLAVNGRQRAARAYRQAIRKQEPLAELIDRIVGDRRRLLTLREAAEIAASRWLLYNDPHGLDGVAASEIALLQADTKWRMPATARRRGLSPYVALPSTRRSRRRRAGTASGAGRAADRLVRFSP